MKRVAGRETVELVESWSSFELAKVKYVGTGNIGSRVLVVKLPPPDRVSGWTDLAIVRLPTS